MTRTWLISMAVVIASMVGVAPGHAEDIAITNARVYVTPSSVIDGATVVIQDGSIKRVAKGAVVPRGARVIDGTGKIVTAGLIDGSTRLGLIEVTREASTREGGFGGGKGKDVIRAAYRVSDGYNATSMAIPIARAHGVTSVVSAPRGGLISGMSGWFSLRSGVTSDAIVKAPLAMYASLGEGALDSAEGSRGMAVLRLREVFDDARAYSRSRRNYERNQSRGFAAGRLDLEALLPVLRGQVPLVIRAHRSSDILTALSLADEFGLRIIISGGTEAWMVADRLAAAKVGVMLDPLNNLPSRFDRVHVRDDAPKLLADAGVPVAISTLGSVYGVRTLRQLAGNAVANGLSYEQALAAITTVPGALFGIDRGELRAGAAADVVVWSGDPLELSSRAEHVIIGGVVQPMQNHQTELLQRYRRLRN